MPLAFYPFRYRDTLTGKWVRARYQAEIEVIAERFAEWEITGPAEQREASPGGSLVALAARVNVNSLRKIRDGSCCFRH